MGQSLRERGKACISNGREGKFFPRGVGGCVIQQWIKPSETPCVRAPLWIKSLPRGQRRPRGNTPRAALWGWVCVSLCSWRCRGSRAGMELHLQQQRQRIPLQSSCDSVPMNHPATLFLNQILGFIIVRAGRKGGGEGKKRRKNSQCFISLSNPLQFCCLKI